MSPPISTVKAPRLSSLDAVRGLIMVVMALDHARDFLGLRSFNATDLSQTTVAFFMTRWVTHFCAPGFMVLAGVSAFLLGRRKSTGQLSRFLASRGLWLVLMELTVIHFAWTFSFSRPLLMVMWALGWSMVCLAGLVWLPRTALMIVVIGTICLHNLADGLQTGALLDASGAMVGSARDWLVVMLHQKKSPVIYPLVPWIAVMALGYLAGPLFTMSAERRRSTLFVIGALLTAAFVLLRWANVYGDASPWLEQRNTAFTVLSFINTTKYPPSLLYLLMTLGPIALALAAFENARGRLVEWLEVIGRVPFFYYVLHLVLLHLVAVGLGMVQGFAPTAFLNPIWKFPQGFGLSLWAVYVGWLSVVVALYLPCRWFGRLKRTNRSWWLTYL